LENRRLTDDPGSATLIPTVGQVGDKLGGGSKSPQGVGGRKLGGVASMTESSDDWQATSTKQVGRQLKAGEKKIVFAG
jgi:hypothetical protein